MRIEALRIGQRVRHPQCGLGTVKALNEHTAEIRFDDGILRTVAPDTSGVQPAEAQAELAGLSLPLTQLLRDTVSATLEQLGLTRTDEIIPIGTRWHKGRLVLHPADPALQTKEVPIEVFFHKITMIRNNLRVLEQKLNAHPNLSEADRIEWQQYITRCYGSLTTFNILFKDKEDQF